MSFIPNDLPQKEGYLLCSIGRFTNAKNFDNVPEYVKIYFRKKAIQCKKWYLIGFGGDDS